MAAVKPYELGDGEYVVLKAHEVHLDKDKAFSMFRDAELMLTNYNIVLPRKGMTGRIKSYEVYPLSDIRIIDGHPQCRLDSSEFMEEKLEVSFRSGIVSFVFGGVENKTEVRTWVNAIYNLVAGIDAPEEALGKGKIESFFGGDDVADTVGRVYGSFKNAFDRKRHEAATDVSMRCPSCNASIKGRPGDTVQCPYCGSFVTIQVADDDTRGA